VEKNHGAENCITGDTGKTVDGERVAEGPAVAVKRGNARGAKHTGKPSAGNLHAGFDEAGAGNQRTIRLVRHSHRKRGATDRLNLRRLAPVLDATVDYRL